MVSSGDGPVGASKMTGEILDVMGSLPDVVEKMTGVSIAKKLNGHAQDMLQGQFQDLMFIMKNEFFQIFLIRLQASFLKVLVFFMVPIFIEFQIQ